MYKNLVSTPQKTLRIHFKDQHGRLFREAVGTCYKVHTVGTNTLYGERHSFLLLQYVVRIFTTAIKTFHDLTCFGRVQSVAPGQQLLHFA